MPEETRQQEPGEDVKKRAIKRVGVAAALALVAAIGLTMMSRHKPPPPTAQPEQTVLPAESPTSPASAVQAVAAEPPPVSAVVETPPEQDAPPTIAPPPPPPQVVNMPQASGELPPKAVKPAVIKPFREAEPSAKPAPVGAPPVAEKNGKPRAAPELVPMMPNPVKEAATKADEVKKPVEAQKTAEPAKPAPSAPPPSSPPPTPAGQSAMAGVKGYAVQLGVFSNPANAIQMQEKLSQHGIQSYTETRLHVGPFKDKAEAEQSMAKVRSLGIGAVVVPLR